MEMIKKQTPVTTGLKACCYGLIKIKSDLLDASHIEMLMNSLRELHKNLRKNDESELNIEYDVEEDVIVLKTVSNIKTYSKFAKETLKAMGGNPNDVLTSQKSSLEWNIEELKGKLIGVFAVIDGNFKALNNVRVIDLNTDEYKIRLKGSRLIKSDLDTFKYDYIFRNSLSVIAYSLRDTIDKGNGIFKPVIECTGIFFDYNRQNDSINAKKINVFKSTDVLNALINVTGIKFRNQQDFENLNSDFNAIDSILKDFENGDVTENKNLMRYTKIKKISEKKYNKTIQKTQEEIDKHNKKVAEERKKAYDDDEHKMSIGDMLKSKRMSDDEVEAVISENEAEDSNDGSEAEIEVSE